MSGHGWARAALLSAVAAISACGGGGGSDSSRGAQPNGGGGSAPPDPIVARSDTLRIDAAQLNAIDVLANDGNPNRGQVKLTIETPADIGTASVNADGTVKLSGLPANFRGVTHFSYKVTNAAGESSLANAAIFVGEDPFRVMFVADTSDKGTGGEEVFVTDMADPAVKLTSASRDGYVLRGYSVSGDGRTVVYRRDLVNTFVPAEFWYLSDLAAPGEHRISFPDGFKPHHEYNQYNSDNQPEQFVASPDGKWIAVVADASDPSVFNKELFLLDVTDPAAKPIPVKPANANWVGTPRFSASSKYLYFEAAAATTYDPALFRIAVAAPTEPSVPLTVLQLAPARTDPDEDESFGYRLTLDDSNVYIYRSAITYWRVWLVDTATPGIEHPLFPASTSLPADQGVARVNYVDRPPGGPGVSHLFYSSVQWNPVTGKDLYRTYSSDLAATLIPRLVSDSFGLYAIRPDEKAMLGIDGNDFTLYEISLDGSSAPVKIDGSEDEADYYYDDSGDTVLVRRYSEEDDDYPTYIDIAYRESFGSFTRVNRANYSCRVSSMSGASRSVVVMSEAPTNYSTMYPAAPLVLVNARAPNKFIPLTAHPTPLAMRSKIINFLPGAAKH